MPYRKQFFVNNYFYHIYNRCEESKRLYFNIDDLNRFCSLFKYYRFQQIMSFSKFINLNKDAQKNYLSKTKDRIVTIIAYCLMPNHFHLLLKQNITDGIRSAVSNIQLGYAKYLNKKYSKKGPVFMTRYQAVLITSEEQLIHTSRYIHLNPVSSGIIKIEDLVGYPYTSLPYFLSRTTQDDNVISKREILAYFKSPDAYHKFIYDQADYQKKLQLIKSKIIT